MEGSATTRSQARPLRGDGLRFLGSNEGTNEFVGALRGLASSALKVLEETPGDVAGWGDDGDSIERLALVRQRLENMLDLLTAASPATGDPGSQTALEDQAATAAAQRAVALLTPLAQEHDVELVLDIQAAAGNLRAGPLAQVMLTGLRNAIDACAANCMNRRCVELSLTLSRQDELLLHISDTGSGVPRKFDAARRSSESDHLVGLDACRRMVELLGGRMELVNVPFGAGAVLKVMVSAHRLRTS